LVNKDKDMPNYNTQGITSSAGSDPRNLGGSEGYGNPTASTSSGIMSSTANPTANDDNKDEPSFFESIANLFSGAGADLPSDKRDDDGDSGISFYDSPMFAPYDGGSDNDTVAPAGLPFETTAADRALYEALGVDVPEVYKGKMPEEEPEPNFDMAVLQKALQPDPITVEELEVKAGDTLTAIAEEKGLPVQAVIDANPQIKNPDLIRPGEVVSLPAAQAEIGQARASIMPAQQEIGQARAAIIMKGIDKLFGMFPPKTKEEKAAKSELEYFLDAQPDSALPDFFKYIPDAVQVQEYLKGRADRKKAAGENVTLPGTVSDMGKLLKTATDPEAPAPVSEDPDREFYQSGVPIEERVFEGAKTGEGLMSDPRKLGGAEGYGKLTKNVIEGTDKEELKETQSRLKGLGFYESAVDGLTGPSTKSAIKTFQHKNGLEVTGIADKATRLKLAEPEGLVAQEKPKRTLLSFISKGEGGYGAANNGTSKLAKKFSIVDGYYSDTYSKPLTEMTVNELMNAQMGTTGKTTEELLLLNPESETAQRNRDLFAAGAYQIIPKTMWAAVRKGAVDGDTVFEPKVQDKIAIDFLAGSDRTKLRDFLQGNPNVSVEDAMLDLAKQWASAPAPKDMTTSGGRKIKKGTSYYGSGNKAQHTVEETKAMLLQARDENVL
jgi:LysM repeat protein